MASINGGCHHPFNSDNLPASRTAEEIERRDETERVCSGDIVDMPYQLLNYSSSRQACSTVDIAVWDELMGPYYAFREEGRDDAEEGADDEEVIVHNKLLRRRHLRKIQKERAVTAQQQQTSASATVRGKALATSPVNKRKTPYIASASPCTFAKDRQLSLSPIRPRRAVAARVHSNTLISPSVYVQGQQFSSADETGKANYPEISPVRCTKRRKLFSTSAADDAGMN